jgi:uncharacterized protein (DUF2236 family)
MSTQEPGAEPQREPPTEEEMQRALEEQLRQIRVQDLLLESVASILNLSARRIAKPDEQDLEQGRIGIEAVRAVVGLLEPETQEQVREALSQVQMLYARESREGGEGGDPGEGGPPPPQAPPQQPPPSREPPPRLWTPGSR